MILPNKYITSQYSLIGAGAILLNYISKPKTTSQLWSELRENPMIKTYQRYVLILDFLYLVGAIEYHEGKITMKGSK